MASKASILGHPLHPILIPFPIALWSTSFFADVVFYFRRNPNLNLIAKFLLAMGCIGAVAAAIPGIVDWLSIREPTVKRVANWHARLNVLALIIFAISLYLRMRIGAHWVNYSMRIPFLLSLLGVIVISISGWLGGELAYRYGVGQATRDESTRE